MYNFAMPKTSAGLVLYRKRENVIEVLLAHPGGPFFAKKDDGVWSIPKGEIENGENLLVAARREFEEETGVRLEGNFMELGSVTQAGGKTVHAWAIKGDADPAALKSNTFEMEWPPRSGQKQKFPEIDRFAFFPLDEAKQKINSAQREFLDRLEEKLRG
jgi:predicted NUDIX family NTP pyrophosphohydrolase